MDTTTFILVIIGAGAITNWIMKFIEYLEKRRKKVMREFDDRGTYNRKFFECQLPTLIMNLERIANALEEKNKIEKTKAEHDRLRNTCSL